MLSWAGYKDAPNPVKTPHLSIIACVMKAALDLFIHLLLLNAAHCHSALINKQPYL